MAESAEASAAEEIPDMEFDAPARHDGDLQLLFETQPLVPIRLGRGK